MKTKAAGSITADNRALARLRWQQRQLDGMVTDGVRMTEILLKKIKAGAPDSPVLQEVYQRITSAVLHSTALRRRLQDDAARIAAKQPNEPGCPDGDKGPELLSRSAITRLSRARNRLEREFFANVIAKSAEKPGRMH
jgi:hypothetical protein